MGTFGGEAIGAIEVDAWEAWIGGGAGDAFEGCENLVSVSVGICVWNFWPEYVVAVSEVETEEGYHHGVGAMGLDGTIFW